MKQCRGEVGKAERKVKTKEQMMNEGLKGKKTGGLGKGWAIR